MRTKDGARGLSNALWVLALVLLALALMPATRARAARFDCSHFRCDGLSCVYNEERTGCFLQGEDPPVPPTACITAPCQDERPSP